VSFVHAGKSENCMRVTSLPPTRKSSSYDSIFGALTVCEPFALFRRVGKSGEDAFRAERQICVQE